MKTVEQLFTKPSRSIGVMPLHECRRLIEFICFPKVTPTFIKDSNSKHRSTLSNMKYVDFLSQPVFVVIHHLVCTDELWTSSSSRMILSESTKSPNICLWLRKACMEVWWNWTLGSSNSLKSCWGRGWSPLCWLLTNLVYTPRFSQAFLSKAVQGPEVTFIQRGGLFVHTGLHKRAQDRSKCEAVAAAVAQCDAIPAAAAAVYCLSDLRNSTVSQAGKRSRLRREKHGCWAAFTASLEVYWEMCAIIGC